ncbi:MAG: HD domain-containing protein [Erysipelotrichaceae bacterium]|nr:HD domain-containing protein [Erysipelotrichaceae bacterium]
MELTEKQQKEFNDVVREYLKHPDVQRMKGYCAHGKISVLEHSINVAKTAYLLDQRFHIGSDRKDLIVSALLHDFYLYDWHDARLNVNIFQMHGYTHPGKACENAMRIFGINEVQQEAIRCHMWPLTLRSVPKHKESVLVCIADKICALKETVFRW